MQQKLGPNKVLVLLDVLETWGECMPKMMSILCKVKEVGTRSVILVAVFTFFPSLCSSCAFKH